MATEFTIWRVREDVIEGNLPWIELDETVAVQFDVRHPGIGFYEFMDGLHEERGTDDYLLIEEENFNRLVGILLKAKKKGEAGRLQEKVIWPVQHGYKYVCSLC